MATVREAVSGGEIDDVRHQLPDDFAPLFTCEECGGQGGQEAS